jgi:hypothetical protein
LSLLANLALVAFTSLGLYIVNPAGISMKLCLVAPIGHLVNSLPLTPGGIGVGESPFNALFKLCGMSGRSRRIVVPRIWSLLVGGLGLLNYLSGVGRIVYGKKILPTSEATSFGVDSIQAN